MPGVPLPPGQPKAKAKSKAKAKAKASAGPAVAELEPKTLDDLKADISGKLNNSICETCQPQCFELKQIAS